MDDEDCATGTHCKLSTEKCATGGESGRRGRGCVGRLVAQLLPKVRSHRRARILIADNMTSLTNEAETAAELRTNQLTLPRLHAHASATGGSRIAIARRAFHNRALWTLAAFYLAAMTLFGVVNSVLSVVFVVDTITASKGTLMNAYFPLSADIPTDPSDDPCANSLPNPQCTYDLAMTALSSELVTFTPYTIGGVTFMSPNGTLGLPYQALAHFARNVSDTMFEDEYRQYCLPVLSPNIITCEEMAVNQSSAMTEPNDSVPYSVQYYAVVMQNQLDDTALHNDAYLIGQNYQQVPSSPIRVNDQGRGTMTVVQSSSDQNVTLVTATANQGGGYAKLLYEMMNDSPPPESFTDNQGDFKYVAACTIPSLQDQNQNQHSSWQLVDFRLEGGVLKANVTGQTCPTSRWAGFSGFADLRYALQASASILSGTDGYTKLLNQNSESGRGSPIFSDLNELEAALNKIYHIVQTSWSQTKYREAMASDLVQKYPIQMWTFPHLLVIRISWTPSTWIGLGVAVAIALMSLVTAARWLRATGAIAASEEAWNLLRPIDLMAYALANYGELGERLNSPAQRRAEVRNKKARALRDVSYGEGTGGLLELVRSSAGSSPWTPRSDVPSSGVTAFSPLLSEGGSGGGGGSGKGAREKERDGRKSGRGMVGLFRSRGDEEGEGEEDSSPLRGKGVSSYRA